MVRMSTTSRTFCVFSRLTSSVTGRFECPMVKNGSVAMFLQPKGPADSVAHCRVGRRGSHAPDGILKASIPGIAAPWTRSTSATSRAWGASIRQTFIDTYSKVACAKLYDRKTPITTADLLNDWVVPFFDSQEVNCCGC
jgi:hypothetical protein